MSNLSDFLVGKGYGLKEVLTSSGTWNWTTKGKPKKVFVRMIGGAGGNAENGVGGSGSAGGNTVWDTVPQVSTTTATGGGGATTSAGGTGNGRSIDGQRTSAGENSLGDIGFGDRGTFGNAQSGFANVVWTGATGEIKEFEYVPTGNVSYTIGAGGSEGQTNAGDGKDGSIELYY